MWHFEHEIFANLISGEYKTFQQTVHKIAKFHSPFQLKSKQELKVKLAIFSKKLILKSQKN